MELAYFFDAVGVKTTIMVLNDRLLPAEDNISTNFKERFTHKADTRFNTVIESSTHDGKQITLQLITGYTRQTEAFL